MPDKIMKFDLNRLVRENVKALHPYSSARDEYISDGSEKIFLDANENPFNNGINRYPDPQQRNLKAVLATQKELHEDQILLGNGSDEVLDLIFRAFCEPKEDNVITMPPTYGMYGVLAAINNIENREVLLAEGFVLDETVLFENIDANTKIIFLCSPNNPTGHSFPKEQIRNILETFRGLVVLDEAYIDFSTKQGWLSELSGYKNLIITQTFSKAYGMAGIRLGCCYASSDIIAILNKIKPPYNVNELTQQRALQAASNTASVARQVKMILEERGRLEKALKAMPFVRKMYPSDANFILVEVDDANKRYQQLLKKGIIVRNRSNQHLCTNTLRFTIGAPEENDSLINALTKLV
jgi:histidinol-phosphate aminotransferase